MGSGSKVGVEIAEKLGYKWTTAAKDLPRNFREKIKNCPSQKLKRVQRIGVGIWHKISENEFIYDSPFRMFIKIKIFKSTKLLRNFWLLISVFYDTIFKYKYRV